MNVPRTPTAPDVITPDPRRDFQSFLDENGVTQAQVDAAFAAMPEPTEIVGDQVHVAKPSPIHGVGIFSGRDLGRGDRVCTLWDGMTQTVCGRYINHHPSPNAQAITTEGVISAIAVRPIKEGEEITLDYRQVTRATVFLWQDNQTQRLH